MESQDKVRFFFEEPVFDDQGLKSIIINCLQTQHRN